MFFSWACIHSTCFAFTQNNILNYLEDCWDLNINNKNLSTITNTVLHICSDSAQDVIIWRIIQNIQKIEVDHYV